MPSSAADVPPDQTVAHAADSRARRRAAAGLAVLALIWGYNWVIMKRVTAYAGPFDFAALRMAIGTLVLFAVLIATGRTLRLPSWRGALILGLSQTAGFTGLAQWALVAGGAGKTAVLAYTMPFWVLLLAWPILGERVRGTRWIPVILSGLGLVLVLEPWHLQGTLVSGVLAVASGLVWAAGAVLIKRVERHRPPDLLALTAWQMALGTVLLGVVTLAVPQRPIEWNAYFVVALAYIGVAGTALGWLLWIYVLRRLPAGTASLGILSVPVIGVLAAAIELGERPSGPELAGMLAIGAALGWLGAQSLGRGR
ncbi:MAG TPA: DMT family transporter [Pelomicrobium sp.]|nr:DMT family transporter [Pelomicrobium sp.]